MLDDLEEFLRRAAEQRSQQQRPQAPPPQPAQPVYTPAPLEQPMEAEIVYAEPISSIPNHVREHHFGEGIAQHASQLGEEIGLTDERLETHLHEAFDHRIGTMDDSPSYIGGNNDGSQSLSAMPQINAVQEIAAMLRDPQSIRNAIVLKTILEPPEFI